jgi:long-chain acyl-CoA synthetase
MRTEYPFYEIKHELHTVQDVIKVTEETYLDNPVFRFKRGKKIIEKSKWEFTKDVDRIGTLFHELFPKASHIAVLGKTSYEWITCYFGAMNSENVSVPLDKELAVEDLMEFIRFSDSICLMYDKDYTDVAELLEKLPEVKVGCEKGISVDCICMQRVEGKRNLPELLERIQIENIWIGQPGENDLAEIVFTSGTMGKSKGCMITHRNLAWNAMNGSSYTYLTAKDSTMSILPINHALEITAGMMTPMCCGVTICINDSLKYLNRNLLLYKPQCMIVVPLVIETLYKNIWREIGKRGQEWKIRAAMIVVRFLYKCHIDIRRNVFAKILEQLGGNLRLLVGGGAYIEPQIIKDFEAWGINIVQGYGITECAPVVACNTDRYKKYDSVGKIVTGCEVKIVEDEIWVKGPIVMRGYYKNQEATAEAFEGEWFKTGDLGHLDSDNYLYITGRKKNLIILPNGENVSPEELEQKIMRFGYVKEVVVSEQDGQIQAEVLFDKEAQPEAEQRIKEDIHTLNKALPNYKKIARVVVREQEFEKTTTQKIKRKQFSKQKGEKQDA